MSLERGYISRSESKLSIIRADPVQHWITIKATAIAHAVCPKAAYTELTITVKFPGYSPYTTENMMATDNIQPINSTPCGIEILLILQKELKKKGVKSSRDTSEQNHLAIFIV